MGCKRRREDVVEAAGSWPHHEYDKTQHHRYQGSNHSIPEFDQMRDKGLFGAREFVGAIGAIGHQLP